MKSFLVSPPNHKVLSDFQAGLLPLHTPVYNTTKSYCRLHHKSTHGKWLAQGGGFINVCHLNECNSPDGKKPSKFGKKKKQTKTKQSGLLSENTGFGIRYIWIQIQVQEHLLAN